MLATAILALATLGTAQSKPQAAPVDFVRDVQPLFRAHCLGCHGPTRQMNNFRLDRRREAMRGGTRPVIAPGNVAGSVLYLRVAGAPGVGLAMPPTGPLAPEEVDTIRRWIAQGAEWPDSASGDTTLAVPAKEARAAAAASELLRSGRFADFAQALDNDTGLASARMADGTTVLMATALYGTANEMKAALHHGAGVNAANQAGATALMWAVDDADKAKLLIAGGADVNARSADGRTPLLIAAGLPGGTAVVRMLLDHGAKPSVEAPKVPAPVNPLIEAATAGNAATLRLLLEHKSDGGHTPGLAIAHAITTQCAECAGLLLRAFPAAATQALNFEVLPGDDGQGWA
ncbi:MAG TPA: ankyrin repeat domain-containing protein, partial [Terriglobales bacterium]|nr:ankyrin repeat domain-containing protein [Terriglobales bacterium]